MLPWLLLCSASELKFCPAGWLGKEEGKKSEATACNKWNLEGRTVAQINCEKKSQDAAASHPAVTMLFLLFLAGQVKGGRGLLYIFSVGV